MPVSTETDPLIPPRPGEQDPIDTCQSNKKTRRSVFVRAILVAWAIIASILAVIFSIELGRNKHSAEKPNNNLNGKRNLVFMVSDGMGPASMSLARGYRQYVENITDYDDVLFLDNQLHGTSRTRSANSLVTDSAAGATAFSCGIKTYNGAISVLPPLTDENEFRPCGSVMEAAKRAGYMTGLVVTTRVTDATPACFASHVRQRFEEDSIAEQLVGLEGLSALGSQVDLIVGGGRCHFLSNTTEGSCRTDNLDVIEEAQKQHGFTYVDDKAGFEQLSSENANDRKLPLLALLAPTDIPYEIDRIYQQNKYPSLEEVALFALETLEAATKNSDKGFFLMIEGSRIDHAGHQNDPAAQVREVMAYDRTAELVSRFLEETEAPGIMIATSDHETGGLSAARQNDPLHYPSYRWRPEVLQRATRSCDNLGSDLRERLSHARRNNLPEKNVKNWFVKQVEQDLGIDDLVQDEIDFIFDHPERAHETLASVILSSRAEIGWSTHGHSAVDVNIYTSNRDIAVNSAGLAAGQNENTDIGKALIQFLGVENELRTISEDLESWFNKHPERHSSVKTAALDEYGHLV